MILRSLAQVATKANTMSVIITFTLLPPPLFLPHVYFNQMREINLHNLIGVKTGLKFTKIGAWNEMQLSEF
jgi:hypothetical protein